MSYPATNPVIPKRVEIAPGFDPDDSDPEDWPWIDITDDVLFGLPLDIQRGCEDEQATTSSKMSFTLDNTSGRYTVDNAMSDLWPLLDTPDPIPVRLGVDLLDGVGAVIKAVGFINSMTPEFRGGRYRCLVKVEAVGQLTIMGQSGKQITAYGSAVTASAPIAYYPMVGSANPAIGGMPVQGSTTWDPLDILGVGTPLTFSAVDGPAGAVDKLPEYLTSDVDQDPVYTLPTPVGTNPTTWCIDLIARANPGDDGVGTYWLDYFETTGAAYQLAVGRTDDGDGTFTQTLWFGPAPRGTDFGSITPVVTLVNPIDGQWHHWRVVPRVASVSRYFDVYIDGTLQGTWTDIAWGTTDSLVNVQLLSQLKATGESLSIGHVAVYNYIPSTFPLDALIGYPGEQAHERIQRVCSEYGISCSTAATTSEEMGPQIAGNVLGVLRDCEAADRGIIDDSLGFLRYVSRDEIFRAVPGFTVDGAAHELPNKLAPVRNDQKRRNQMTVNRKGGGSTTYTSPDADGRFYAGSLDVNVASDERLTAFAQHMVAIGTVGGYRYPSVPLDFLASPTLVPRWLELAYGLRLGDRITLTNLQPQQGTNDVTQQIRGISETFQGAHWSMSLNTVSTRPYEVMIRSADGDRRDAYASTIAVGLSASLPGAADSLSVLTSGGMPWTTTAGHFPLDVAVAGERMRATAVSAPISDTFTRTTASGWGTATSGQSWALNGGTAANYSTNGSIGQISTASLSTDYYPTILLGSSNHDVKIDVRFPTLSATANLRAGVALRFTDSSNYYTAEFSATSAGAMTLYLRKKVAGSLSTIATVALPGTYVANTWMTVRGYVIGSTLRAKVWTTSGSEPTTWTTTITDTSLATGTSLGALARNESALSRTIDFDNLTLVSPQTMTVTRGINRVCKVHAAGETIALWRPLVRAL